jgi:hypothetical protein
LLKVTHQYLCSDLWRRDFVGDCSHGPTGANVSLKRLVGAGSARLLYTGTAKAAAACVLSYGPSEPSLAFFSPQELRSHRSLAAADKKAAVAMRER